MTVSTNTPPPALGGKALAELSLLGVIWGASFLSIRIALDEVSVLSSVCHRVGWAALILWLIVWSRGISVPRTASIWGAFLVMGLLNNAVPFTLMAWGQLYIETGLTSILNASTAIWGALAAALAFGDERLTAQRAAGIGLGFAGVVTIVGPGVLTGLDLRSTAQIAVIAGTLSYAAASVWARLKLGGLPPIVAAAGMLTGSTMILVPLTLVLEGGIDLPDTARGTIAIAYYAGIATALAYLLYYRILATSGAGGTMLVTLLIPPVAVCLGAVVLGERLEMRAFAGLAVLALGLVVLAVPRRARS
ncbi:MAG: DMT family transporter [Pseudomonadota bacterium]